MSAAIRRVLCLLPAVPNLELLTRVPGVLESPLPMDKAGRFSVMVSPGCTILLQPDHDPIPHLEGGGLACTKVNAVIILEVNGYGL